MPHFDISDGQPQLDPRYDARCKAVMAERAILARLMKGCIPEYTDIPIDEIETKCIEDPIEIGSTPVEPDAYKIHGVGVELPSSEEATITHDIQFIACVPSETERLRLMLNFETQYQYYPGYPLIKRGIYYGARMISSQYGTVFVKSHYEKIIKTYSIWVCTNPSKKDSYSVTHYRMAESKLAGNLENDPKNYDLMNVIIITLGKKRYNELDGIFRMLNILFIDEMPAEEKTGILKSDLGIEMTPALEKGVAEMCNLSAGVFERGVERGMERGIERGMERGMERGRLDSLRHLMYSTNWSADVAMNAMGIPPAEQAHYAELLRNTAMN